MNHTDRIEELIERYGLADGAKYGQPGSIRIGNMAAVKRDNALDELRATKAQVLARFEEKEAHEKRRKELISQIDGLAEIKAAKEDLALWHEEFEESFRNVGGMGVRPKPTYDINAMLEAHPRAAAYLKAEAKSYSANYELASIGAAALEEVIFGDYTEAMKKMDEAINSFTERHIWD